MACASLQEVACDIDKLSMTSSGVSTISTNSQSSEQSIISMQDCWEDLVSCHLQIFEVEQRQRLNPAPQLNLKYTQYEFAVDPGVAYLEALLPQGSYFVGDLCQAWAGQYRQVWGEQFKYQAGCFNMGGLEFFAVDETAAARGQFVASSGHVVDIGAGHIGILPLHLCCVEPDQIHDKHITLPDGKPMGCRVTSDIPITFKAGGGVFQIVGGLRGWSWRLSIDTRFPATSGTAPWLSKSLAKLGSSRKLS